MDFRDQNKKNRDIKTETVFVLYFREIVNGSTLVDVTVSVSFIFALPKNTDWIFSALSLNPLSSSFLTGKPLNRK